MLDEYNPDDEVLDDDELDGFTILEDDELWDYLNGVDNGED